MTESRRFFHGTSALAAKNVLSEGHVDQFARLRLKEAICQIWPELLNLAGGDFNQTAEVLAGAGSQASISIPIAFKNVVQSNPSSQFSYGHFYVTSSIGKAARYACRNESGSELVEFIGQALRVVDYHKPGFSKSLRVDYEELDAILRAKPHPMILCITGIGSKRLLRDNGEPVSSELLELDDKFDGGLNYRISGLGPQDIAAVYDLSALEIPAIAGPRWAPSDDGLESVKSSPAAWLDSLK